MKKTTWLGLALGAMFCGMTTSAQALTIPVNTIGSTFTETGYGYVGAYDTNGTPPAYTQGYPTVEVTITGVNFTGWATLSIVAEGIDVGEVDEVFFGADNQSQANLGTLTQQDYAKSFLVNLGPDTLEDLDLTTLSITNFTVWVTAGQIYKLKIVVDPTENWVNEIQTVSLTPVPEPTTMLLFGTGLVGLVVVSRKKRN